MINLNRGYPVKVLSIGFIANGWYVVIQGEPVQSIVKAHEIGKALFGSSGQRWHIRNARIRASSVTQIDSESITSVELVTKDA